VALKPSELSPCTAAFLADNIGNYLDPSAVQVINGGPEVGEQLMEHRWDKVLFTGKPGATGTHSHTVSAAARNGC
jgi:aldehyde dehydrogenase (NAD+)